MTDVTDVTDTQGVLSYAHASSNGSGPGRREATCGIPAHRDSDWAMPAGEIWICGVCHPPAIENVVHRNGRAWDETS